MTNQPAEEQDRILQLCRKIRAGCSRMSVEEAREGARQARERIKQAREKRKANATQNDSSSAGFPSSPDRVD